MATISEERDIDRISLSDVEYAGYSKSSNWLYVRLSGDEYYFVTANGQRIKEGMRPEQKALDSSAANDKLDQLISGASGD